MTRESFRNYLRREVERAGSQRNLAKKLKISPAFLNDILLNRRDPGEKILERDGLSAANQNHPASRYSQEKTVSRGGQGRRVKG